MLVAGIDTETTGLDKTKDRIIEIAVAIFDDSDWEVKEKFDALIYDPTIPPLRDEIKNITKISDEDLCTKGIPLAQALGTISITVKDCSYFLAHNKNFDKDFFNAEVDRTTLRDCGSLEFQQMLQKPWICSAEDVPHPKNFKSWKLQHLAVDHGVMVDPSKQHRALADVLLMGKMMAAGGFKVQDIVDNMNEPWVYLKASIPAPWDDGGKGKTAAQARGYKWEKFYHTDPQNFPKTWVKKVKQKEVESERAEAPFPVLELKIKEETV